MSFHRLVQFLRQIDQWPLPLPAGAALFLCDELGRPELALPPDARPPSELAALVERAKTADGEASVTGPVPVRVTLVNGQAGLTAIAMAGPDVDMYFPSLAALLRVILDQEYDLDLAAGQLQNMFDQIIFLLTTSSQVNTAPALSGQLKALLKAAVDLLQVEGGIMLPPDAQGHSVIYGPRWLAHLGPELWDALRERDSVLLLNESAECDQFCPALEGRARGLAGVVAHVDDEATVGFLLVDKIHEDGFRSADRQLVSFVAEQLQAVMRRDRLLAARTAQRLRAQEMELGRQIYQALVPRAFPTLPGIDLAVFSRPALELGGDFHHAMQLPDGRLLLLVGDAAGKGLPAALIMSQALATLRAVASSGEPSPARILVCGEELMEHTLGETELFVTIFAAVLDPVSGHLTYADAGHGYTLHRAAASGEVTILPATGAPFGLIAFSAIEQRETQLAPGDALMTCSDGIMELWSAQSEQFGMDRLRGYFGFRGPSTAEGIVQGIEAVVDRYSTSPAGMPPLPQSDDITALITVRKSEPAASPPGRRTLRRFDGVRSQVPAFTQWVHGVALAVEGWDAARAYDFALATEECFTNILEHAYEEAGLAGPIVVTVVEQDRRIQVSMFDEGARLEQPAAVTTPSAPDPEDLLEGGYGLFLMRQLADEVSYQALPEGNAWTLWFSLSGGERR